jgi:DnaK suppressor protein
MFVDEVVAPTTGPDYEAWISPADRRRLAAVYEALDRMDTGNYGLCTSCGTAIDRTRLESIPWVNHCQGCEDRRGYAEVELDAA